MIALVVDIETTGLSRKIDPKTGYLYDGNEILEVGYLRVDTDTRRIVGHGTLYFYKPHFPIENKAQSIHGLTREFLEQYEDDFDKNLIILNALVQNTCIIGKNSDNFDIPYIEAFIKKYSKGVLDYRSAVALAKINYYGTKNKFFYENTRWAQDVQVLFKDSFNNLLYNKTGELTSRQGTLSEYIDILGYREVVNNIYNGLKKDRVGAAHTALYDVVMTYAVWCWLCVNNKL